MKTRWPLRVYSTGFLPASSEGSEAHRREKHPLPLLTVNRSIKSGSMQPVLHIRSPLQQTRLLKVSTGLKRVNCPSLSGRTEKNKLYTALQDMFWGNLPSTSGWSVLLFTQTYFYILRHSRTNKNMASHLYLLVGFDGNRMCNSVTPT